MTTEKKTCDKCGASMMEYRHGLTKPLLTGLRALFRVAPDGTAVSLSALGLERSVWDNFQKLRYWGLVKKGERAGLWSITDLGVDFLHREVGVHKYVWTYRGTKVRFDGRIVRVTDVVEWFEQRPDFRKHARPRALEALYQ